MASWIAVHRLAHPFYFFSHLILLSVMHVPCMCPIAICIQSVYNLYTVCVMTNPIKQQQNLGFILSGWW